MNIAVAAITLNIFSPFILFYFFALAAVAPTAWRWLKWRGIRSGSSGVALLAAVQLAANLKPLPGWPPEQEPRFLQG